MEHVNIPLVVITPCGKIIEIHELRETHDYYIQIGLIRTKHEEVVISSELGQILDFVRLALV